MQICIIHWLRGGLAGRAEPPLKQPNCPRPVIPTGTLLLQLGVGKVERGVSAVALDFVVKQRRRLQTLGRFQISLLQDTNHAALQRPFNSKKETHLTQYNVRIDKWDFAMALARGRHLTKPFRTGSL